MPNYIAGLGLTGLVDVGTASVGHVYFRELNATVPQASILVTFSNVTDVIIKERQLFLLSIEKGFKGGLDA